LELHGEWMFCQCYARVVLVRLQGRLEKRPRSTGRGLVTHTTGGEEIWY